MTKELTELVEHVADHLIERDMENEDWEKGAAINGLLANGRERDVEEARRIANRAIQTQTSEGKFNYDDPKPWLPDERPHRAQCEPVTPGHAVLEFYDRTGEERYIEAAHRQYEFLVEDAIRTEDECIAYSTGPVEIWVDSLYMLSPFFARYGELSGVERAFDEAVSHIEAQTEHLQDDRTDLFRHEWREEPNTYPESSLWARGNGWALTGMIDTLEYLPDDHSGRKTILDICERQASALLKLQDASGLWHHILDYRDSPLETSATLQFSYAFMEGVERDILPSEYAEAAERGMEVCKGMVNDDGEVRRVAVPPGGPDAPLDVTSYGQGWFLMAGNKFL